MTEKEIKEFVAEIRRKSDIFRNSGFATTGITNVFDKSADIIEELLPYMAIDTVEEFKALKDKSVADNMLIDGLIKFCDEKSKNIKLKAEPQVFVEIKQALEELKEYKLKEFQCHLAQQEGITIGYNKAIDELVEALKPYKYGRTNGVYIEISLFRLDEMAEQMKAGGKNE